MTGKAPRVTIFQNEDLIFDLKTGNLIKISDRLRLRFGGSFDSQVQTFVGFERLISTFSDCGTAGVERSFDKVGDQIFNYTLDWQGVEFLIRELSWVDHKKQTFHSVIFIQDRKNIFEVSYNALVEIVEKMESPAILLNQTLTRAIVVNAATAPLLNQPFSVLAAGFIIKDFFVEEQQFLKVIKWISEGESSTLQCDAKLYLEKAEGTWYELSLFKTSPDDKLLILCILKNISVQKATEEKLTRTNELLSRVVEVQNHFLSKSKGANPYDLLLSNILNVIDAKLGFVGKVDFDEKGKQVLRIHAATDISSTGEESFKLYHNHVKNDFLFRHFDNLFGACIVESKIILENNPSTNPHAKGKHIPGHPTIENFLGVPIFKGDEVIGLVGLGNKVEGFTDQDITHLKPFISAYSVIIEAYKSEQDKIRFEKDSMEKAQILAKVADHSADLIVVMDDEFSFEFISPSASQFFDHRLTNEEIQKKIRALLKKTLNSEYQISEDRYRSRLKMSIRNEGEYWVESNVTSLYEESNHKVIAVIRDVSSQINFEQRLIGSLKKEKQFNSFLSDFMNIVSHEFKTPLATMISSVELTKYYLEKLTTNNLQTLGKIPELENIKIHGQKIERELDNLHKLVIHSLDYERFVNNSPVLKKEKVSLSHFVKDTLQTHDFLDKVDYVPDTDIDQAVEWDKFLIQTSITNLVSNALKYGGKSRKPVVRPFQKNELFGIEITDYGIGITEEDLPFVFTPFFRGSNSNGIPGSGFGLVAVKNFVELHGGTVSIESKLGTGTKVTVRFTK
ncbi:ATP-binding protein [Algoriphagus aquimarinus]|uniref:histidine kinase n=1 Tax=Algoriphagus aquimarinus TaxID=237018 RepID=A0A1I1BSN2_9BACT|nr:ATP-binding protein [Algoriphagus aquimarinus]SFB53301.1 Signal transduction histidine kinase [Algoriphagus aquimarinus]